jgi:hypothetical protein
VIAIQRPTRSIDDRGELQEELSLLNVPSPETLIEEDDIVVVVGSYAQIENVSRQD